MQFPLANSSYCLEILCFKSAAPNLNDRCWKKERTAVRCRLKNRCRNSNLWSQNVSIFDWLQFLGDRPKTESARRPNKSIISRLQNLQLYAFQNLNILYHFNISEIEVFKIHKTHWISSHKVHFVTGNFYITDFRKWIDFGMFSSFFPLTSHQNKKYCWLLFSSSDQIIPSVP